MCPQRAFAQARIDDHRRAEGLGHLDHAHIPEIGTDLRQIGSGDGPGMQVDAVVRLGDDLFRDQVRDSRRDGALLPPGERAIQVAAVRQIARAVDEPEDVDDRDGQQAPAQPLQCRLAEQALDDLDAVELVAVQRGRDEERRTRRDGR